MPIFINALTRRELQTRSGDLADSQPWAQEFTERLASRMTQFGEASKTKSMELTKDFNPFLLENVREERQADQLKLAGAESQKALESINRASTTGGPIRSLSQLVQRRSQKRQQLQQARKSLERANEMYKFGGVDFRYEGTGYTAQDRQAPEFESQFDTLVEQRKQEYAEMYGYGSFDEVNEGYGMLNYTVDESGQAQYTGVGQRDIMDMIMSDITGIDYETLARLNTIHVQDTPEGYAHGGKGLWLMDYTGDQMAALKDFYTTSNLSAFKSANERAVAEDKFRKEAAQSARQAAIRSGKTTEKSAEESLGKSAEEVQLQLRDLDEDFMKKVGAFNVGPRKKKVRSVSFEEGRPL